MFNAKKIAMDVIYEIIRQSAIGPLSKWYKSLVLSVFSSIVLTCVATLILLFTYGVDRSISLGY